MRIATIAWTLTGFALFLCSGCGTISANRVAEFNGSNQFIQVKDAKDLRLPSGDFTMAAWVNIKQFSKDSNSSVMAKRGPGAHEGWTWYIAGDAWPTLSRKMIYHVSQGDNPFIVSNEIFEAGRWYHIALVYTAETQTGQFYVNGKPDNRATGLVSPNPETKVDLYIGRDSSYARYFFNGMLDDVAIFKRALSPAEITHIASHSLHGKEAGLIALWNFDRNSPRDASPEGHNGVLMQEAAPNTPK